MDRFRMLDDHACQEMACFLCNDWIAVGRSKSYFAHGFAQMVGIHLIVVLVSHYLNQKIQDLHQQVLSSLWYEPRKIVQRAGYMCAQNEFMPLSRMLYTHSRNWWLAILSWARFFPGNTIMYLASVLQQSECWHGWDHPLCSFAFETLWVRGRCWGLVGAKKVC